MARSSSLFTDTRATLVSAGDRAVDHHVCFVVIDGQMPENPLDHTAFSPPTQSSVHVFPATEPSRKVTPGNTRTISIQYGFHEQMVVRNRAADMTFPTGKKSLYPLPLVVAQTVSPHPSASPKAGKQSAQRTRNYTPHATLPRFN